MTDNFHSLLQRQIRKATQPDGQLDLTQLLSSISSSYEDNDREIALINNAISLMSEELIHSHRTLSTYAIDLNKSKEQYELATRGANDGLWDWDLRTGKVFYSARWKEMIGLEESADLSSIDDWFSRIHPDFQSQVRSELDAHLAGLIPRFKSEYQIICANGETHWLLVRGIAQRDDEGNAIRIAGSQSDIEIQKTHERQLEHAAFHDALTTLPNRALFLNRLEHAVKKRQRVFAPGGAVLFLDLDRFKVINDSLGHAFGDKLLVEVTKRLSSSIRPGDTLARLGGDEFVLLLEDIPNIEKAISTAERIIEDLRVSFTIDGEIVCISASVGIALITNETHSADLIMRQADLAMYAAKSNGKNRYAIYGEKNSFSIGHMQLEKDLQRALDRKELYLVYQPVMDMQKGCISSFEALVRWDHPEFGLIPPAQFIPVAEESGIINPLGLFVLDKACEQLSAWHRDLPQSANMGVNVNVSLYQLSLPEITNQLLNIISNYNLPTGSLKLEITESALAKDTEVCLTYLKTLKEYGIELCIDDFGTGFSSLNQLNVLPFDILKIDRSFVNRINMDEKSYRMISGIITLAHSLDFKVVAEGIETAEELAVLKRLKCDFGQGYLFSRPVGPDMASEMIVQGMTFFECAAEAAQVG